MGSNGLLLIRPEVLAEPVPREHGYPVQAAGFFEQVTGSGDDFELMLGLRRKLGHRRIVQVQDYRIVAADDKQCWRQDPFKGRACQVWPASARDHRLDDLRALHRRDKSGRRSRAGPEIAEAQILQTGLPPDPVGNPG